MTLTKTTGAEGKWYPTSIASLEVLLKKGIHQGSGFSHVYALRRNIAYNLQYLEFLDRVLCDIKLSSVLTTQTYKMFILTGCGIMESLLAYLLIKSGHHNTTIWELEHVMPGQEKKMDGAKKRVDCHVYRKLASPKKEEMTFDSMIKKAEAKRVLGSDHSIYSKLQALRKLRNKVHLQVIDNPTDTDWNSFQHSHLCAMSIVIHDVFTGNLFRPSQEEREYFAYLMKYNPSDSNPFDEVDNIPF